MEEQIGTIQQIAEQIRQQGGSPRDATSGQIYDAIDGLRRQGSISDEQGDDWTDSAISAFIGYYQEEF